MDEVFVTTKGKFRFIFLVAPVLLILTSCMGGPETQPTASVESTPTDLIDSLPSYTFTPSPTSTYPEPTSTSLPVFTDLQPGQYVVYNGEQDGWSYAAPINGDTPPVRFTNIQGRPISPDGTRMVYHNQIYDILLGTTEDISFLESMGCVAFSESPDRKLLAVGCLPDHELFVISVEDRSMVLISDQVSDGVFYDSPLWSPDGRWISYIRITANIPDAGYLGVRQLFLVDTSCLAEPETCIDKMLGPIDGEFFIGNIGYYQWSPDSRYIAVPALGTVDHGLLIYDMYMGTLQKISWPGGVMSVAWSPDGEWLTFSGWSAAEEDMEVFKVSPVTGEVNQLTFSPGEKIVLFCLTMP